MEDGDAIYTFLTEGINDLHELGEVLYRTFYSYIHATAISQQYLQMLPDKSRYSLNSISVNSYNSYNSYYNYYYSRDSKREMPLSDSLLDRFLEIMDAAYRSPLKYYITLYPFYIRYFVLQFVAQTASQSQRHRVIYLLYFFHLSDDFYLASSR